MRSPLRNASSLDATLIYSTAVVLALYIIITIATFQRIPPLPTVEDFLLPNQYRNIIPSVSTSIESVPEFPEETFPQSILDVPMETILHPAVEIIPDLKIPNLTVPAFYDPPQFQKYNGVRSYLGNNGESLMTLEQAQNIGSKVNGLETIFVAIASYRDFQCRQTVESIFTRATHPERIRVAVVDQIDKDADVPCSKPEDSCESDPNQVLCKYKKQIDFYTMEAQFAMGPVFARHLGNRMYRGEYFAIQCDAHVDFVLDWDSSIIKQWKSANNEMSVLTAYLSDVHGSIDAEGHLLRMTRPIMCNSDFEDQGLKRHLRHGQQPEGPSGIHGEPTLEPYWAAGFSFSRGHFIVNVPYDQHLPWVFQGEEISIGLRGFTYGYDYYTPETSPCFHYYAGQDTTGKRNKVKLFWENTKSFGREHIQKVELDAFLRLNGIIHMNPPSVKEDRWIHVDEKKYGIGKVRTPQKFVDTFGIDLKNHKVEQHLCKFVGKNMHLIWKQHLREDTMGIDYDKITYRFKDPDEYGITWKNLLPH
jgi:[Skp1-protein]-hydroxyproline N-acetylglucosaminyltransferase